MVNDTSKSGKFFIFWGIEIQFDGLYQYIYDAYFLMYTGIACWR